MIKNIPVPNQHGVTQTVCSHKKYKDICLNCLMETIHGYKKNQYENKKELR